ncbi:alpha-1,2-fucosyltransferase [Kaistella sp. PBT33-4]|uniref:alpha-1,2-fucosyltransferase n=1 Tax=Kaistella sp. PBT33-4 TaxID=3032000 RepID=UPI0023D8ABB4|nr:alpha-1,2-fucosyltransferase [Kaistella sp. PBT33-4]MDF0718814.1 alpha-1,2-fucosyltransferase [Kaistella sp. PBT33-4]
MITVKVFGGLGNQLFQYAFGQYASQKLGVPVRYDVQTSIEAKNFTKRTLGLDYFCLEGDFFTEPVSDMGTIDRLKRKLIQEFPGISPHRFVQKHAHDFSLELKDGKYYEGYWQGWQYLEEISLHLRTVLVPTPNFFEKHANLLEKMRLTNSVSIHIRREDYLSVPKNTHIYHICDEQYYERAMNAVINEKGQGNFFVFTQDSEWAGKHFPEGKFTHVKGNSAVEDLLLMSFCKHNIIGNSTFSWWAAWLNPHREKMVIAPQKWYINHLAKYITTLIPQSWKTVG